MYVLSQLKFFNLKKAKNRGEINLVYFNPMLSMTACKQDKKLI